MKLSQGQQQQQQLLQRLKQSQFQIQQSTLIAMSLGELEATVRDALNDNPALEKASDDDYAADETDHGDDFDNTTSETDNDFADDDAEKTDEFSSIDTGNGADADIMEVYGSRQEEPYDIEAQQSLFGDTESLRDKLKEQASELDLTETDRYVINYVIDSIDDDGILHDSIDSIADTLAIYHGIDITTPHLDKLLKEIQQFDPPGVGARSLKESLLLQAKRQKPSVARERLIELIDNNFDDVCQNNWEHIRQQMHISRDEAVALQEELRRLNPHPGRAIGESGSATLQQITPDFIVDTDDHGHVTLTLNKGHVPTLSIADSFVDIIERAKDTDHKLSRSEQEALVYAREKVQSGRSLIAAIERRWTMLHDTMQAIIDIQHRFFIDGDDASIVSMTLKDVAERVGVSQSTISRVSNEKYVDTPWGIFPLKHFFAQATSVGEQGQAVSHKTVIETLKDIVASENPDSPYIDDQLVEMMKQRGFECSRRTISKYRALLGIPTAKMRKRQ